VPKNVDPSNAFLSAETLQTDNLLIVKTYLAINEESIYVGIYTVAIGSLAGLNQTLLYQLI